MSRTLVCLIVLILVGCGQVSSASLGIVAPATVAQSPAVVAPVTTTTTALIARQQCANTFVQHALDYTTTVRDDAIHLFESNGSGVAINDLDGDADLDLVFANLDGPNTILWNEGNLQFRTQTLDDRNSRAVNIVDVNGDGWQDVVFTHRAGSVSYWRNLGAGTPPDRFVRESLANVRQPAYAMNWGDVDGDGTLDLATGSYDAELGRLMTNAFLFSDGAGVFVYKQHDGAFTAQRLAKESQTLAIAFPDLDGDDRSDVLVGNDFGALDQMWLRRGNEWSSAQPFAATTHSTMSFDWGDIDNNGTIELFATDMKPYAIDTKTLAAWLPMMASMPTTHAPGDPQIMDNVLHVRGSDGAWHNGAFDRGVDATGWSWSGKFGDLDNDGFLDLYVVNGMIAAELFAHLPNNELIEENQARRNDRSGRFVPAPDWGLGSTASGRGMSMADLDNDGDLDVVINNLQSSAQLFENQLCSGAGVEVDLRWLHSMNTYAIGAELVLHTSAGSYTRDVRAASGYLSGDPARIHFGLPAGAVPQQVEIRWPDGAVSSIDVLQPQTLLTVTR